MNGSPRAANEKNARWTQGLLLAMGGVFVWSVWGYVGHFFADGPLAMEQVHRFARGEVLYRDFYWPFPPVALWAVGTLWSFFGITLAAYQAIMATVFLLITTGFFYYAARLAPWANRSLLLVAGLVLSVSYSFQDSVPVMVGMYTPAAPVGFLLLLAGVNAVLGVSPLGGAPARDALRASIAAACCALAILTKQDFWIPSAYVMGALFFLFWGARSYAPLLWCGGAFLVFLGGGLAPVVSELGWSSLPRIATGYGMMQEMGGLALPSWERMVVQLAQTGLLLSAVLIGLLACRAVPVARWRAALLAALLVGFGAAGVHLWKTASIAQAVRATGRQANPSPTAAFAGAAARGDSSVPRMAVTWLYRRAQDVFIPVFVPGLVAMAVAWRWKKLDSGTRGRLLFAAGLCLAARSRRAWQMVEWYSILLELPVYALAVQALLGDEQRQDVERAVRVLLVLLLAYGGYNYWYSGVGPLTRRGSYPVTETPRGPARFRLGAGAVQAYQELRATLQELDPAGSRPLLMHTYTDGLNFFLNRRNPTPMSQGFRLSRFTPEELAGKIEALSPPPILVDSSGFRGDPVPAPKLNLRAWEPSMQLNHYEAFDRPRFEKLAAECRAIRTITYANAPFFTVYDCPARRP